MIAKSKIDAIFGSTKALFDLLRSIVVFGVILFVLVRPSFVSDWMKATNLDEVDLPGAKFKRGLAQVDQSAKELQVAVTKLEERLEASQKALEQAATGPNAGKVQETIEANEKVIEAAQATKAGASQTLQRNSTEIGDAQKALQGEWGVVFGADTSVDSAEPEVERARHQGLSNTVIFRRQDWFRSTVIFGSREDALSALPTIKALSANSSGAYIVNLPTWCPNKSEIRRGLIACS